jgi:regulator of ribonuclease E activity RraA/HMG-CHA aldolase family protein
MGGLAKNRPIRAMIIDGAGRDVDELRDIGFTIWTRAITPRGTHIMFSGRKEELSIFRSAAAVSRFIQVISSSPMKSASLWCTWPKQRRC